jgi:hypothetical protein
MLDVCSYMLDGILLSLPILEGLLHMLNRPPLLLRKRNIRLCGLGNRVGKLDGYIDPCTDWRHQVQVLCVLGGEEITDLHLALIHVWKLERNGLQLLVGESFSLLCLVLVIEEASISERNLAVS